MYVHIQSLTYNSIFFIGKISTLLIINVVAGKDRLAQ